MRHRAERAAIWGFAAALGACASVDEVVTEHRSKIEATLTRMEEVAAASKRQPTVAEGEVSAKGAVLSLGAHANTRSNAAVVYAEDLEELAALGNVYARFAGTTAVAECASFLQHKTLPWDPRDPKHWTRAIFASDVRERFEECERMTWAFVLRTVEFVPPSVARLQPASPGANASASQASIAGEANATSCARADVTCTFSGGYAKIEVHVFALDPVAPAGGFTFEVESGDKVSAGAEAIESDFRNRAQAAFAAAVKSRVSGAEVIGP